MSFAIRPDQPNAGAVFNAGRVAPHCMIGNVTRMDATATSACCNAWGHGIRSLTDGRASLVLSSSSPLVASSPASGRSGAGFFFLSELHG